MPGAGTPVPARSAIAPSALVIVLKAHAVLGSPCAVPVPKGPASLGALARPFLGSTQNTLAGASHCVHLPFASHMPVSQSTPGAQGPPPVELELALLPEEVLAATELVRAPPVELATMEEPVVVCAPPAPPDPPALALGEIAVVAVVAESVAMALEVLAGSGDPPPAEAVICASVGLIANGSPVHATADGSHNNASARQRLVSESMILWMLLQPTANE